MTSLQRLRIERRGLLAGLLSLLAAWAVHAKPEKVHYQSHAVEFAAGGK